MPLWFSSEKACCKVVFFTKYFFTEARIHHKSTAHFTLVAPGRRDAHFENHGDKAIVNL